MTVADERPSWDEYFLEIATEVATRSTCMRRHVGAVLVRDKRILTTGYNGAPRGLAHCSARGCLREKHGVPSGERHELCRGLHAEMNAMLQAASYGVNISGSTLYATTFPCSLCVKMAANCCIERVVTVAGADYPDDLAKDILGEAGIKVDMITRRDG